MAKNYSRVQRGMVFWFNPDLIYGDALEFQGYNRKTYKSSVQHGNRPWLVVSNDEGNQSSYTCNIVPITLEDKTEIPVHVHFEYEGKPQTILCEQGRTVDRAALGEYIYTLGDEVMNKVEKALVIQYKIRPLHTYMDFTLDNIIQHLEKIVTHIIEEKKGLLKAQENTKNWGGVVSMHSIEDAAVNLGAMIEDLVGVTPSTQPAEQPKTVVEEKPVQEEQPQILANTQPEYQPTGNAQIDKFNQRLMKSQQLQQPKPAETSTAIATPEKKSRRNKWTPESRRQYLKDCDTMTPNEIMEKYHFNTIQTVFQTKYLCKNALGISD